MKNVLILCTGNSCRSIIAEALLNARLSECLNAFSSGVAASGRVNSSAKKILQENHIWCEDYHSKKLETVMNIDYDLVVTVCDNAQETCPIFPGSTDVIHVGFEDPDGMEYSAFQKTYEKIEAQLIPIVKDKLC